MKAVYVQGDMSKPDDCRELVRKAAEALGSVSTSSSTMPASNTSRPVEKFPPERWDAIIAIKPVVRLPHVGLRRFLPCRRHDGAAS